MVNRVNLLGKILELSKIYDNEDNVVNSCIKIKIPNRNNDDDIVDIVVEGDSAIPTKNLERNDLIGIDGKVSNIDNKLVILANKVFFIASIKENKNLKKIER